MPATGATTSARGANICSHTSTRHASGREEHSRQYVGAIGVRDGELLEEARFALVRDPRGDHRVELQRLEFLDRGFGQHRSTVVRDTRSGSAPAAPRCGWSRWRPPWSRCGALGGRDGATRAGLEAVAGGERRAARVPRRRTGRSRGRALTRSACGSRRFGGRGRRACSGGSARPRTWRKRVEAVALQHRAQSLPCRQSRKAGVERLLPARPVIDLPAAVGELAVGKAPLVATLMPRTRPVKPAGQDKGHARASDATGRRRAGGAGMWDGAGRDGGQLVRPVV